jgi:hypothetical protein
VKTAALVLILLILGNLVLAQEVVRETVEEVVAVVDRTPILRSDVDLALILGIGSAPPGATEAELRSTLLDARIRLEVQYRDLEASGVLYRLELDVDETRRRLVESAGGDAELAPRLAEHGLDGADLDELALRIGAANAYAEQRLRPRVSVGIAEIEAAYLELAAELAARGEEAPPLAAVSDRLHRLVAERKLNDEIERWLERAYREREVTRFVR